jgi:hypothetical protein
VKAIISTFSFLALFIEIISAQKIDVGLFQHLKTDKLFIEASSGKYKIKGDGKKLYRLKKDRNIILKYANGMISVSNSKKISDYALTFRLLRSSTITIKVMISQTQEETLN